jgi:hypothetical protein
MGTWTESVLAKLAWMRAVDLNHNEFGASTHQYRLANPISNDELKAIETQNGFTFPPSLREFWLHAGAGGAGPHLGALGPLQVTAFRPSEPVTDTSELRRKGSIRDALWDNPELRTLQDDHERATGTSRFESLVEYATAKGVTLPVPTEVESEGYYEGSSEDITGLLGVIEIGCGHMEAIAVQPPHVDRLFSVDAAGGVWETESSFPKIYDRWIDGLINTYTELIERTIGGVNMETVRAATNLEQWKAVDRLVSVRGIEPPLLPSGHDKNRWVAEMLDHFATLPKIVLPPLPSSLFQDAPPKAP